MSEPGSTYVAVNNGKHLTGNCRRGTSCVPTKNAKSPMSNSIIFVEPTACGHSKVRAALPVTYSKPAALTEAAKRLARCGAVY